MTPLSEKDKEHFDLKLHQAVWLLCTKNHGAILDRNLKTLDGNFVLKRVNRQLIDWLIDWPVAWYLDWLIDKSKQTSQLSTLTPGMFPITYLMTTATTQPG